MVTSADTSKAVQALDASLNEDLEALRRDGLFRPLRVLESAQGPEVDIAGKAPGSSAFMINGVVTKDPPMSRDMRGPIAPAPAAVSAASPPALPLRGEISIRSDQLSLAYRRYLREIGMRYGVITR